MGITNFRITRSVLCLLALIIDTKFEFGVCFSFSSTSRQTQTSEEYTIDAPTFEWDGFRLNIDYQISGSIVAEQITYDIVSDKDCEGGIVEQTEIESSLIEVSDTSVRLSLLMNPQSIHSARYVTHYDNYAIVGVCARLWINKPNNDFEPVSGQRDDYLMIQADLEDLNGIEEVLEDKSRYWGVKVYRCDESNFKVNESAPALRNGEKLRLCVEPTRRTRNDGVFLGTIKSFHFERDGVMQNSVGAYGNDESTNVMNCHRGSDLCVIESVLSNDFFYSPGEVKAEGVVFLQWGYEEDRRHRSLRSQEVRVSLQSSGINTRSLYEWYEQGEIVSEKETQQYMVDIEPMEKSYSAEAFPCDDSNKPVQKKSFEAGEITKICIQPDVEARDAGVYINSVESFSYALANDDRSQEAIDSYGRVTNDNNRTQVECASGAIMCSISSTLDDRFFDKDSTVVATGYVTLQFGTQNQRDLQSGLGFAGRSRVEAYFDAVASNDDNEKGGLQNWFKSLFDQWDVSDSTMTALYIVAVVLFVLILLCCFAGCFFLFYVRRERVEPRRQPQQTIDIKINRGDNTNSSSNDDYDYDYVASSSRYDEPPMSARESKYDSEGEPESPRSPRRSKYDSNGELKSPRKPKYDSNGELKSPRKPRYDSNGELKSPRKSRKPQYDSNGELKSPHKPKYDSNGELKSPRKPRYNSNGELKSPHKPKYDSNGELKSPRKPRYDSNGELKSPRKPKYDSNGKLKSPRKPRYDSNGELKSPRKSRKPQYDSNGELMSPRKPKYASNGDTKSPRTPRTPRKPKHDSNGDTKSPRKPPTFELL